MELNDARFCVDCEKIFEGTVCPECGRSVSSVWLSDWLMSLKSPLYTSVILFGVSPLLILSI